MAHKLIKTIKSKVISGRLNGVFGSIGRFCKYLSKKGAKIKISSGILGTLIVRINGNRINKLNHSAWTKKSLLLKVVDIFKTDDF